MSRLRRAALLVPPVRRLVEDRDRLARELKAVRDAGLVVRDDLGYVFVVTYGRSGSTLLAGLLNAIPGYDVKGENGGATHELFRYYRVLTERQQRHARRRLAPTHPWYGLDRLKPAQSLAALRATFVGTVLRPRRDARVTGFKEIRWFQGDHVAYVRFLQELFPGARFIINTRDHAAVAQSKWWAEKADPLGQLAAWETVLDEIEEALGDAAYRVHYDDYVADHEVLRGLYAFLGETFDRSVVDGVMDTRYSY